MLLGRRPHRRAVEQKAAHPAVGATGDDPLAGGQKARVDRVRGDLMLAARMLRIIDAPQADVALALDHQQPPGVGGIELDASRVVYADWRRGLRRPLAGARQQRSGDEQSGDAATGDHAAHS